MHFNKFPDPSTFQCWKTSFKTDVCSCSNFPTDAMLWIKEVEMVDSVDNLKTSQSIGGHRFPNFEMVDAKIASALKKIISNPYCKTRVNQEKQKAQMQDRLLRVRQIAKVLRILTSDWSTRSCSWLCRSIQYLFTRRTIFKILIQMALGFIIYKWSSQRKYSWTVFSEDVNKKVWSTPKSIGNGRTGNPSRSIESSVIKGWRPWWGNTQIKGWEHETQKTEMKDLKQEYCVWLRDGRMSALKGEQLSMASTRTVLKRRCLQCPPRQQEWKESTVVHSCSEVADTKVTEENFRKESPSEAVVHHRADIYFLEGNCTNRLCDFWHLPECQNNKTESGWRFREKCAFMHE